MDLFARIKWLILARRYQFSQKAQDEMQATGITKEAVFESIVNAPAIHKVLRSRSRARRHRGERLYVILGLTSRGELI